MMRMVVVGLMMLQLHSAMMEMGHGKLKPKQSRELIMLREKLVSNNDDYDNLMIAEYTPLRAPTHAPRFKVIDNQANSKNPLARTPKWKHRQNTHSKATKNSSVQKAETKNWHLELPDATKASNNDAKSLDLQDKAKHGKLDFEITVRTWKPALNVDTSVEKVEHLNNLSSDSKDDTENEPETTKSMINNKKGTNLEIPTFNREALESENIKDMTNTFNRAISEIKNKINGTMMRKNPDYKHTWRTWEPESESQEDSHLAKLEHQIAARMDSSDNETDSSENTEDLNDLESENTLHLDVDSEISEDKVKKTTDRVTLPIKVTNATTVTSVLNKQPDYNTWRTWKHFIYTNGTTRLPEHVRSTNTKVSDYDEYKYWKNSREAQVKVRRETPPTKHLSEKIGAMHWRVGTDESDI
ncbi:uncharacterized protein [Choristoneura fumiferana]|uniref:uncharacterized protein n=1 Tax=Choristoneura fumiferana TaxID=7141 RepID=UPI003D15CBB9